MEWDFVTRSADKLRKVVEQYHPASTPSTPPPLVRIDAPMAELACGQIRDRILADRASQSPLERFDAAVAQQDREALYIVLQETWFGVPESRSAWNIPGFRELCDILENI